jgi:hypothetical protein
LVGVEIGDQVLDSNSLTVSLGLLFVDNLTRPRTALLSYPQVEYCVSEPVVLCKSSIMISHQMLDPVVEREIL